jgi:hypothetical protein
MATARASSTAPPSLAERAARRDAELFRGRTGELERLKSALVRELARTRRPRAAST